MFQLSFRLSQNIRFYFLLIEPLFSANKRQLALLTLVVLVLELFEDGVDVVLIVGGFLQAGG